MTSHCRHIRILALTIFFISKNKENKYKMKPKCLRSGKKKQYKLFDLMKSEKYLKTNILLFEKGRPETYTVD